MGVKRTARDIMRVPVFTAPDYMPLTEVIKIMARNNITGLPVVDDNGNLMGMITWRTIMNLAIMGKAGQTRVSDAMSKQMSTYGPTCGLDTPLEQILTNFAVYRINRMLVVDDSRRNLKVLGIICRRDVINVMDQIYSKPDIKGDPTLVVVN